MIQNSNKIEELSKIFSFKLADRIEKNEISLDETRKKIHNFLILAMSADNIKEIEKMIEDI